MTEQQLPTRPVLPLRGTATGACALIVLSALAGMAVTVTDWHTSSVADAYIDDNAGLTIEDLRAAERLTSAAAWVHLGVTLLAACLFLLWSRRARANAEALSPARHRRARGWVIGGWFCPVVNFWFPYQVVSDIEKASRPVARAETDLTHLPASPLVGRWWAVLVAGVALDQYVAHVVLRTVSAESLREAARLTTVATALQAIAAGMVLLIVRRITVAQDA
ncbi:DUF4328 domain-containing protein [Amycolatopsis sp. YIM 10]|uniref:DUF4328 domain-containing protein n=1 Tax=Amycolatopsis sp. YIM 10 TaxID=2653857 RepID=UPI0012903849|nr:DUF4328 domain-containing protein [Amycolatopsis sp. YIM 10]QFU85407.1 hypothetical protein YIM_00870 [Amycolatopsis sp. YIM 10]